MNKPNDNDFLLSRSQIKAGRVLAGLGIRDLAATAGLSPTAVSLIETGKTVQAHEATLRSLRLALESKGIEFDIDGWVRHRDDIQPRPGGESARLGKHVAAQCRQARTNLGLTDDDIAEEVGISRQRYGNIENGSRLPSISLLLKLCDALEISLEQMLGGVGRTPLSAMKDPFQELPELPQFARLLRAVRPSARRLAVRFLKELRKQELPSPAELRRLASEVRTRQRSD